MDNFLRKFVTTQNIYLVIIIYGYYYLNIYFYFDLNEQANICFVLNSVGTYLD